MPVFTFRKPQRLPPLGFSFSLEALNILFQRHYLLCIFKSQYVFYTIQLFSIDNCTGNNHFLVFGSSFINRNTTCIPVLSLYCLLFHIALAAMNLQRLIGYFNRCLRCIILRHRRFFCNILACLAQCCRIQGQCLGCLCLGCLLYTSDAADEEDSGDFGGRRFIKKKNKKR